MPDRKACKLFSQSNSAVSMADIFLCKSKNNNIYRLSRNSVEYNPKNIRRITLVKCQKNHCFEINFNTFITRET